MCRIAEENIFHQTLIFNRYRMNKIVRFLILWYFSRLQNSIGRTEVLLPYVGVERDRGRGTKLVYLFLAKVQSSHWLTAQ